MWLVEDSKGNVMADRLIDYWDAVNWMDAAETDENMNLFFVDED